MPVVIPVDDLTEWRVQTFKELGFSITDAERLASALGLDGFKLSHHDVRRWMGEGATYAQILQIFSN